MLSCCYFITRSAPVRLLARPGRVSGPGFPPPSKPSAQANTGGLILTLLPGPCGTGVSPMSGNVSLFPTHYFRRTTPATRSPVAIRPLSADITRAHSRWPRPKESMAPLSSDSRPAPSAARPGGSSRPAPLAQGGRNQVVFREQHAIRSRRAHVDGVGRTRVEMVGRAPPVHQQAAPQGRVIGSEKRDPATVTAEKRRRDIRVVAERRALRETQRRDQVPEQAAQSRHVASLVLSVRMQVPRLPRGHELHGFRRRERPRRRRRNGPGRRRSRQMRRFPAKQPESPGGQRRRRHRQDAGREPGPRRLHTGRNPTGAPEPATSMKRPMFGSTRGKLERGTPSQSASSAK